MTDRGKGVVDYTTTELSSSNTMLAAALAAVGIPFQARASTIVTGDHIQGNGRITWYFEPQSKCGKYKTRELMAKWADITYPKPGTPEDEEVWGYIKAAMQNHGNLIKYVKAQTPLVMVRGKGGKIGFVSLDLEPRIEGEILRRLGI